MRIPPEAAVLLVAYNSARHLRPTLEALFAQRDCAFEALLIDNASQDDSLAIARGFEGRGLKVVPNGMNRGFAGGNNQAAAATAAPVIVLLNPDAVLDSPLALAHIVRSFAENAKLGVLGAKLVTPSGLVEHMGGTAGIPAHTRLLGHGDPDDGRWNKLIDVEFVIGACMAVRRETWDALGGFDEFFNPAYYEDTDLCHRARAAGWQVQCDGMLRATHVGNVSTAYKSPEFYWMHHKGRLWHTAKNLPMPKLLFKAVPLEAAWFCSANARGLRRMLLRLYWMVLKRFVKRRVLRLGPLG